MPFWITWVNPWTQKRERVYNYFDEDTPEGRTSVELAKKHLSIRLGIPPEEIPGFRVEQAEWIPPRVVRDT